MAILNLDKDGDWLFFADKSNFLINVEEIGLQVQTRLQEWKNDCFFDSEAGIDYQMYFRYASQKKILLTEIHNVIARTEGVTEVKEVTANVNNNVLSVTYEIKTSLDDKTINNELMI